MITQLHPGASRIAELGLPLLHMTPDGRGQVLGETSSAMRKLIGSPVLANEINKRAGLALPAATRPLTICPGLTVLPVIRPDEAGLSLHDRCCAVVVTRALLRGEWFARFCDQQQLDCQAYGRQLRGEALSEAEASRMIVCLRWMQDDAVKLSEQSADLRHLGEELAVNYEELSLLYKLSCSMTLDQPPALFFQGACAELQEVSGLAWLSLYINGQNDRIAPAQRGRLYVVGREHPQPQLTRLSQTLIKQFGAQSQSQIFDDTSVISQEAASLSRDLLAVPLTRNGQTLGLVLGGERLDGQHLDSNDSKLCASLANSLSIFTENLMLLGDAHELFMGTLLALTSAIDAKDSYTHGHSERVALLSRMLAEAAGLGSSVSDRVYLAGLIHDVGKIGVPERVLSKPGRLTDNEFELIKRHPEIGAKIVRGIRQMQDLVPGVLHHHERWDGRGYPRQLAGEEIPIFGRLIGLADAFDAMSSTRTYRSALNHQIVLEEIRKCRGAQFDPELAEVFVKLDFEPFFDLIAQHKAQTQKPGDGGEYQI